MKNCPFCAEEIQDAALVCKHCGRDLVVEKPVVTDGAAFEDWETVRAYYRLPAVTRQCEVRNETPNAFDAWRVQAATNGCLLLVLLLAGLIPGILYLLWANAQRPHLEHRYELSSEGVRMDGKPVPAHWLRAMQEAVRRGA